MPFQFTFSLPSLPLLNPWRPTPPPPTPPRLSTRGGWMPSSHTPSVQLTEAEAQGWVQVTSNSTSRIRARDDPGEDQPPAKRRRTIGSTVVDMLSYALLRSGGAPSPSPSSHTAVSQETEPPAYDTLDHPPDLPLSPVPMPGSKRRPRSLSPEARRRVHGHPAGRKQRAGKQRVTLTPGTAGFNPFRPSGSPRTGGFTGSVGVASQEEEGVVGSVPSVIDLQMSRMDSTLQALLAEGAKALGQEIVLPEDGEEFEQDTDDWEDA
ncbi:hypothetical protein DACRYDRAFT_114968 [Dacryopinax primogenitus]|uniref:Uncharacterized protein n=1 Tax=Dacryopinax primogenitus (strain DJM 731) TaxID=1858805 RepID=M5GEU2_DACPD|nr:uncharacterized protein DACRYDRAFT_114968 [Dacryopinax primogenitus]EJU03593.1 hypothetical protein DACRYDRAFT_114968 [Dacryopinax primogenitus]